MFSQAVFLQGLGMGASLIMPIGAQNAHVIRTGVRGHHVLLTAAACIAIDMTLIAFGMAGFGALIEASPRLLLVARWGGAAFLLWYGARCLVQCRRGDSAPAPGADGATPAISAARALGLVMALSLFNPHVYLDTVVLLGAVGSGLASGHRASFAVGAMLASLLWFSGLALVARYGAFWLGRPAVWRAIEGVTGVTMLVLAATLLLAK
jgi:L-lysine exporter family protein LysE/ArgO